MTSSDRRQPLLLQLAIDEVPGDAKITPAHRRTQGQKRTRRRHQPAAESAAARADHRQCRAAGGGHPAFLVVRRKRRAEAGLVPNALLAARHCQIQRSVGHEKSFHTGVRIRTRQRTRFPNRGERCTRHARVWLPQWTANVVVCGAIPGAEPDGGDRWQAGGLSGIRTVTRQKSRAPKESALPYFCR